MSAVRTEALHKHYGEVRALDGLDLAVEPWLYLRLPRAEWCREDDGNPHSHRPCQAHQRSGVGHGR